MKRKDIVFIWRYRKEALSLVYLFLIGMAFGAIWIFYDNNAKKTLAFEEDHDSVEMVVSESRESYVPPEIPIQTREKAWRANAVKMSAIRDDRPQIAIVIDDLAVVRSRSLDIINLPAPLTLSFLPYAPDLPEITRMAHNRGHELMVHLPMEPKGDFDPGPHALLTHVSHEKMRADLIFNLSRFDGYVGLNNHMGSAFTEDRKSLDLVLDEVQRRGLLVLDSRTSRKSLLAKMSTDRNIPNMTRDFFLDNEQDVDYIFAQLTKLEDMARRKGSAIAIGHPYAETIEALTLWLPTLKARGIMVVPLSHLIKRKYEGIRLAKNSSTAGH
ncbi:Putative periplasmic protein YibQ, distant homology with nucleoside diphosphatase and polysaccharide deacetylase [hydrothermal vent metagenome]|uniref:Periplasmic protein YibQ, distant homology with nucleoside diphosphatase and polysaccharide deacetylase n=1 Tax=hydrothermal vent metagenome TaxID=652676 RepID=A0A3B0SB50_9ZZZZ